MPRKKLKVDPVKALMLFSALLVSFTYGMAVVQYRIFPFDIVWDAKNALDALVVVWTGDRDSRQYRDQVTEPTVRNHADIDGEELILVSGGNALGYLKSHNASGCMAWLMSRQGDIKHVWTYDPATWADLKNVTTIPGKSYFAPTGLHLYDDGGLLVNFTGRDCYPPAVGIARYDRDSNLLWKKELLTHHWFSVAENGRIFVPAIRIIDAPISIGNTGGQLLSNSATFKADYLLILDASGNVLDEISMLDALFDSGYAGLFQDFAKRSTDVRAEDPLHLNDVRLVRADVAQSIPWLDPGDLLLSFRNINAVGILDPGTRRFKWMVSGVTVRQHSPRFYDEGILLFDNRGGDRRLGGTQLVHVDLERRLPRTIFPRSADSMPDECWTEMAGHLDLHRDGNRVLMAITEQGVVWEVDLLQGKVLWEYIYVHPNESGEREEIETAKYVYDVKFPLNREERSNEKARTASR